MAAQNNNTNVMSSYETIASKAPKRLEPKLRFNEFEGEWKGLKLVELGVFKNGLNKDKKDFGFGHPFVNLLDVFGKSVLDITDLDLVNANKKELGLYDLKKGDVLFIRSSVKREGVGETTLVLNDLNNTVYSGFLIRFRENGNSLDLYYKRYCFSSFGFRKELLSYATSSANTNINQESLSQINLYFPSLPEQQKIAQFLTAVDSKLQQLTQKKELLEQYKKGVMQQLFNQQLRFKKDDGSDYPDWEEKKLGDVFRISAGGDVKKENVSFEKTERFKYPIFANSEKEKGFYGYSDLYKVDEECVTVTGRGSLGIANARFDKFYPIVRLLVLKPIKKANVIFFENLINSIRIFNESTGVPQLTSPQLATYKIKFPCIEEQQKIANYLSAIDTKIETVTQQIETTQQFKKGLLQQMFV